MTFENISPAGPVFSEEALYNHRLGEPLEYKDRKSGRTVSVIFNPQTGVHLSVEGRGFENGLTIGVDGDDINLLAGILLNAKL